MGMETAIDNRVYNSGSAPDDKTRSNSKPSLPPPIAPKPSMSLSVSGNADKSSGQPVSNSDADGNAGDSKPAGSPAPKTRPKLAAKPQRRQPENLPTDKLRDVLAELVKTEESYVVKLSLLVAFKSDLRRRANEGANLGVDLRTLEQMIPVAVESIRAYHANMLLPTFQKVYSSMLGVSWQSTLTAVDNDIIQLACGNATSNAPRDAENVATQSVMQVSTVLSDCSKLSQVFKAESLHKVIILFYKQFVPNFERTNQLATEAMQNKLFAAAVSEFLKPFKQAPLLAGLSIAHHLLDLVQRLPRYPLLLKEYQKCFRPREAAADSQTQQVNASFDQQEFDDAGVAIERMTESVCKVNASIGEMVNQARLLQLVGTIDQLGEELLKPGRCFVCENHSAFKIAARSFEAQARSLFLFNDLLLLCKRDAMYADFYRVHTKLTIGGPSDSAERRMCVVTQPFPAENVSKWSDKMAAQFDSGRVLADLCMRVRAREKDVVVQFADETSKAKWKEHLSSLGARVVERGDELDRPIPIEELGMRAPSWQDDSEATRCALIDCPNPTFTFINRRHHCRACGRLVCGVCSSKSLRLAYSGKKERICTECYEILERRLINQAFSGSRNAVSADSASAAGVTMDGERPPESDSHSDVLRRSDTVRRDKQTEAHVADYLEVRERSEACFTDHTYKPNVRFDKFTRAYLVMPRGGIHLLLYVAKNDPVPVRRYPLVGWSLEPLGPEGPKAKAVVRVQLSSVSPKLPPKAQVDLRFPDEQTRMRWTEALQSAVQGLPVGGPLRKVSESASACSSQSDAAQKAESASDFSPQATQSGRLVSQNTTLKRHSSADNLDSAAQTETQTQPCSSACHVPTPINTNAARPSEPTVSKSFQLHVADSPARARSNEALCGKSSLNHNQSVRSVVSRFNKTLRLNLPLTQTLSESSTKSLGSITPAQ